GAPGRSVLAGPAASRTRRGRRRHHRRARRAAGGRPGGRAARGGGRRRGGRRENTVAGPSSLRREGGQGGGGGGRVSGGESVEAGHLGRLVVGAEELQQRVAELGKEVTSDYAAHPPLLVGVLKGAFVFMSDLSRSIDLPVEFDFMAVSSYGSATRTSGVV